MLQPRRPTPAFTLTELLIVTAIIGILIGLLVVAVRWAGEAAARIQCQNNLKQMALGFHEADDANGAMPPCIGRYPGLSSPAYGSALFFLLPFVEQDNLFNASRDNAAFAYAPTNNVYARPVKLYLCPSDPTTGKGVVQDSFGVSWGACSYAVNAQAFAQVFPDGEFQLPQGCPRLATTFADGTSNTILLAEKYARCYESNNPDLAEGGNFWAYAVTGPAVEPLHPAFAVSWYSQDIGPGSMFQSRPQPGDCDPTRTSSGHASGMVVALADGSTRVISQALSGQTWWAACTPNKGDLVGPDW